MAAKVRKGIMRFLGRGARIGAPLASVGATMADLASPVAAVAQYAAVLCVLVMSISGIIWFLGKRRAAMASLRQGTLSDDDFQKIVDSNPWSVTFSFSAITSVILLVFVGAQAAFAEQDKGLIGTAFPEVEKLQTSLFKMEKSLALIQRDISALKDKNGGYDINQLKALENQGNWEELVQHLEDISPAERDSDWKTLVERASFAYVKQLSESKGETQGSEALELLIQRFPSLKQSKELGEYRADIAMERFRQCYRNSQTGEKCYDEMLRFVKSNSENVALAMAAGKLAALQHYAREATPFFAIALETEKGAPYCEDEVVWRAFENALQTPPHYDTHKAAQKIATGYCWGPMKAEIIEYLELTDDTAYFRDGMCAILKEKNALSGELAKKKNCPL